MDTTQSENRHCDVLVIGGGPAGSTVSALLADKGWSVVLLEKERHPRFHIGESLLPMNLPILKRLGVLEQVEAIGMPKYAAQRGRNVHGWHYTAGSERLMSCPMLKSGFPEIVRNSQVSSFTVQYAPSTPTQAPYGDPRTDPADGL